MNLFIHSHALWAITGSCTPECVEGNPSTAKLAAQRTSADYALCCQIRPQRTEAGEEFCQQVQLLLPKGPAAKLLPLPMGGKRESGKRP